jgi:RecB family exonuclease
VVVAGLQDGAWPDTRLRGSLLGSADLVDVLSGRDTGDAAAAHRQVLDDERRLLHVAVTRARRRLVATAVRDEDERPSAFLDLVDPPDDDAPEERPFTSVPRPVSLPGLVAELRQVLLTPGEPRQEQAAAALARLAAAGVPGAHPDDWYGLAEVTDDGPLRGPEEPVVVSPSRVESFLRCGLRWLLETSGGTAGDSAAQGVGTLVHEVVAQRPDAELAELTAALDARWASLGLPAGWVGERERARAHRMLARYTDYVRTSGRELVGVEVDVDAQVGRAVVRGRVDRLERDAAGRLVVVDLKTTKSPPKDAEVPQNPQLGVYQVAVEAGGAEVSGGAVLVQLGSKNLRLKVQGQPPLADADDPAWAAELLERAADGMAGAEFAATASELCRVCPVAVTCPLQQAGRQVGA